MRTYITDARQSVTDALGEYLDDDLIGLYVLLALVTGENTTNKEVHDAWSVYTQKWRPTHNSLVPFEYLRPEVQELDTKYRDAIRKAARAIRDAPSGVTGP